MDANEILFRIEGEIFPINMGKLPSGTLFHLIMEMAKDFPDAYQENAYNLPNMKKKDFLLFYNYIHTGITPNYELVLENFPQFMLPEYHSYELSQVHEREMRANMYNLEYRDHPMRTDLYYRLIKYEDSITDNIYRCEEKNEEMIMTELRIIDNLQTALLVNHYLEKWNFLFDIPGVFIAGGSIFAALTQANYKDIDIFIYGGTYGEALNKTEQLCCLISNYSSLRQKPKSYEFPYRFGTIIRSQNAITIRAEKIFITELFNYEENVNENVPYPDIQIILRLYNSPSEVLHGFDVDCCSIGYDGKNVWLTQRALFSLINRYNTVNFDLMSPSYCDRLIKYAQRGISIRIPNFNNQLILKDKLSDYVMDGSTPTIPSNTPKLNLKGTMLPNYSIHTPCAVIPIQAPRSPMRAPRSLEPEIEPESELKSEVALSLRIYSELVTGKTGLEKLIIADRYYQINGLNTTKDYHNDTWFRILNERVHIQNMISDYETNGIFVMNSWKALWKSLHNRLMECIREKSLTTTEVKSFAWIYMNDRVNRNSLRLRESDITTALDFLADSFHNSDIYPLIQSYKLLSEKLINAGKGADIPINIGQNVLNEINLEDEVVDLNNLCSSFIVSRLSKINRPDDYDRATRTDRMNHYKYQKKIRKYLENMRIKKPSGESKISYIEMPLKDYNMVLSIDNDFYDLVQRLHSWDFPAKLEFKITFPGEQMTNTFHPTILTDRSQWYKSEYYNSN